MFQSKKRLVAIFIPLVIASASLFYHYSQPKKQHKKPAIKVVEVATAAQQPFKKSIKLIGTIQPKHASTLIAKGSGRLDIIVTSGKKVSKGTVIAAIDNIETEKNLQLSITAAELAKSRFLTLNRVGHTGYVSKKEIEEKKQAWIATEKEVALRKIERDHLRVYAPFDGIIGSYMTRDGSEIKQGDSVVQFFDPTKVTVDVDFPCNRYPKVSAGDDAIVANHNYSITHLQAMLNPNTHMCPADVNIECDDCLLGNTIDVEVVVAKKASAIVIPYQALFLKNNKSYAYIINKDNKVVLKPIETGLQHQQQLEIISGLSAGDKVVVKAQERLYPGQTVKIYSPELNT